MTVLAAVLTLAVVGIPVALRLDRSVRGGALLGLGFLYGSGLIYVVLLVTAALGFHWSLVSATALLLAGSAACLLRLPQNVPPSVRPKLSLLDVPTAIMVAAYAFYATIAAPWEWDFWALWGLKGRTFFEAGTIDWAFLERPLNSFVHPDYPLLVPLNYVYVALLNGGWDDRWLGVLFVAFAVALLLIVREFAGREVKPLFAAAIAFAATGFVLSRAVGLAELPLIAFGTAGLLFARRGFGEDEAYDSRQAALLLGGAAACKNEGLALLVFVTLAAAIFFGRRALRLWPGFLIAGLWQVLRLGRALHGDLASGSFTARAAARLSDLPLFVRTLAAYFPDRWSWLWIVAALGLFVRFSSRRDRFLLCAMAFQSIAVLLVYLGTPRDLEWHVATSWARVTRQLAPPLLYVVMVMLARLVSADDDLAYAEARSDH